MPEGKGQVEFGMAKTVDEKLHLITRGLQEVMGGEEAIARMREILEKRNLKIYWGTATTGAPHIAYFVPVSKIADFLRAGCEVTILFADLHAYLDNQKAPWALLQYRTQYYEAVIKAMLRSIGVPLDKLRFIRGTEFQLSREYSLDVYRLTAMTTERNAKKAGAEVVKQVESPFLSGMIYPLLQALDEQYLDVDAQFGGVDQRKIFTYAETYLPRIGYQKRIHLMNPMVPSLQGGRGNKMSSSESNSKIDLLEDAKSVNDKVRKAFAEPGKVEDNGLLAFTQRVIFPLANGKPVTIEREERHGGNIVFNSYEELEKAYSTQQLWPLDLKSFVASSINKLLEPIRAELATDEMKALIANAYPANLPEATATDVVLDDIEEKEISPEAKSNAPAAAPQATGAPSGEFYKLDLRCAKLQNVRDHPGADSLYLVDGVIASDGTTVPVITNLKKSTPAHELEGKMVVLLCNMKPTSFRGEKSLAMLLGGSSQDGSCHDLVVPPADATPGDRLYLEGQCAVQGEIARANEKVIAAVFAQLSTTDKGQLTWNGQKVTCAKGPIASDKIFNAVFSPK